MFGAKLKRQMLATSTLHSALHSAADPFLDPCAFSDFSNMNMKKASGGAFGEKKEYICGRMWSGYCSGRGLHEHVFLSLVGHKTINIVARPQVHPQLSTNQPPVKCETQKLGRWRWKWKWHHQQQQRPETEAHNSLRELITQQQQLQLQIHARTRATTARNPVNSGKNQQRNDMDTHIKCASSALQLIFPHTELT